MIDQISVAALEATIRVQFRPFAEKFGAQFGWRADESEARWDTFWTCFALGRAKGVDLRGWSGVVTDWVKALPAYRDHDLSYETWYRCDLAAIDTRDGGWWTGQYSLDLLLEHENNLKELKGHFRQFFDFTAPDRVLVIWTDRSVSDARVLVEEAKQVHEWCRANGVPLVGRIHLIVGDWNVFRREVLGDGEGGKILLYELFEEARSS